mmetsp:Transcript_19808/g.61965  ORF Transcript_19808/g.61965 Transcript_19808/m.61965 type:complete len:94 (+) Transcript_19808:62-343(+)
MVFSVLTCSACKHGPITLLTTSMACANGLLSHVKRDETDCGLKKTWPPHGTQDRLQCTDEERLHCTGSYISGVSSSRGVCSDSQAVLSLSEQL